MEHLDRVVVIDTETTGKTPKSNRIIEISCVEIIGGELTGSVYTTLINSKGHQITQEAFRIHRIFDHELTGKPKFKEAALDLVSFCSGAKIVSYNAEFDCDFIKHELERNDMAGNLDVELSNAHCLMKHVTNTLGRKRHIKLTEACKLWSVDSQGIGQHRALSDALLAAKLYLAVTTTQPSQVKVTHRRDNKRKQYLPRAAKHPITGLPVQLNTCRNVHCENFGVVPIAKPNASGKQRRQFQNGYRISGKLSELSLQCDKCGNLYALINNSSHKELLHDLYHKFEPDRHCCPNTSCQNHDKDIEAYPSEYRLTGNSKVKDKHHQHESWYRETFEDGKPAQKPKPMEHYHNSGEMPSQRVMCKRCGKRFSIKLAPEARHYRKDSHHAFFQGLMSGMSDRALCETLKIQTKTIYDKLNFIHQQCLAFEEEHKPDLLRALAGKSLALSTDRQHYNTNWKDKDRIEGRTSLRTIATVDNITGFVLGSHLNFDYREDAFQIREKSAHIRDTDKARAYRRFGQYSLPEDYVKKDQAQSHKAFARQRKDQQRGILIHETHQMLSHFDLLKPIFSHADSILWSLDNDSGLANAFASVLLEDLKSNKMCALLLSSKERDIAAIEHQQIQDAIDRLQLMEAPNVKLASLWFTQSLPHSNVNLGNKHHDWYVLPANLYPRITAMAELSAAKMSLENLAALLRHLGMIGVDRYFRLTRDCVHKFRRPVSTAKRNNKSYAFAGYDPQWQAKLTDIFRVYYNYCLEGKLGTPAQRLGIRAGVVDIDEILSFCRIREVIQGRKRVPWTPYDTEIELPDSGEFTFKKR